MPIAGIYEAIDDDGNVVFTGTQHEFDVHFNLECHKIGSYYKDGLRLFKKYKINKIGEKMVYRGNYKKKEKPKKKVKEKQDYVYENLMIYGNVFVAKKSEAERMREKGLQIICEPSVFGSGFILRRDA